MAAPKKTPTTKATTQTSNAPKPLSAKAEARLAPVIEAFPDRPTAVAYGRKLIKVEMKLRTSAPPKNDLSDAEIKKIRKLIEIPAPESKPAA